MSAEIYRLFREGFSNARAEQDTPRYNPPLCCVPMKPPANEPGEQTSKETVTVKLGLKTTPKVKPFEYTNVEGLLKMHKHHEYILSQQEEKIK